MAFSRVHNFVTAIADSGDATLVQPSNWNEAHNVSGADVGGIPYCPTATTETTSANLTYDETSGPRFQVGSGSGTSHGWILGYQGVSGQSGMWPTGVTLSADNYAFFADQFGNARINSGGSGATLMLSFSGTARAYTVNTAGHGWYVVAGTATTDVQALSATQTWNAAGVAFTALKTVITDTASAAGALAEEIFGGASGTTSLRKLTKGGAMTIPSTMTASSYIGEVYTLQSTAANFNPADAGTYYQGMSGATPNTTAAVHVVPIPVAGTITNIRLEIAVAGTLGSSETSTVSLRLNNTTDTQITAAGAYTAARQAYSADVSITVAAGDYFQIKIAAPTWATTNPTAVVHSAVVTIRTT